MIRTVPHIEARATYLLGPMALTVVDIAFGVPLALNVLLSILAARANPHYNCRRRNYFFSLVFLLQVVAFISWWYALIGSPWHDEHHAIGPRVSLGLQMLFYVALEDV